MKERVVLTESEESALAIAVEVGIIAADALEAGSGVAATRDELASLVREGCLARERLLLANTGLVKFIARGELGISPADLDEVIQEGHLAMAEALVRYDHRRGRFGPYAAAWIRARVRKAVTTHCGQVEMPVKELMRHYAQRRAESELTQTLGREVSVDEVSVVTGITLPRPLLAKADLEAAAHLVDEGAARHLDDDDSADLGELLAGLPPAQRHVLRRRFGLEGEPIGRTRLADELGISEATVRRLEQRALAALRAGIARRAAA